MMMRPPQPEAKEVKVERWFDVSEKVMAVLEEQYALGLKERVSLPLGII
jgi:hypothetical protein